MGELRGIDARGLQINAELIEDFGGERRDVPFLRMLIARAEGVHQLASDVFRDAYGVVFLVFSFERGAADGVDGFALLVHHVVVFEQVFAGLEVLRFDGLLARSRCGG